jgi:hypothetical protein
MVILLLIIAWHHPAPFIAILLLAGLSDWFGYLVRLPPHRQQLAMAAHGVGVIICGAYIVYYLPLPPWYESALRYVYTALCVLGIVWLFIGSARAQIYGDAELTIRAIAKFGFGWGVWLLWGYLGSHSLPLEKFLLSDPIPGALLRLIFVGVLHFDLRIFLEPVATLVAMWCWSTSMVQFLIATRRRPGLSPIANPGSHGTSVFTEGGALGSGSAPTAHARVTGTARPRNPPSRRRG